MYENPRIENEYPLINAIRLRDFVSCFMKINKIPNGQARKATRPTRWMPPAMLDELEIDFAPSPDEVARRAYLSYVNQGSQPGHDVQHWLEAEQELLRERNLTRVHGFHHRT